LNFISYAQNLEDVMLWRALKHVNSGFYIDVGACDPVADSVTKAFYDAGWSGINVEPMARAFRGVAKARPRDINLQVAIDRTEGTRTIFSVDEGNGLSTGNTEYAEAYRRSGRAVEEVRVPTRTLESVCREFAKGEIHFLKVDVEGSESEVLEGADFSKFRPWIVLVEATEPNTTRASHEAWEPILTGAGYAFRYFDGLNRFYVAEEKLAELSAAFDAPPNWFDHYQLHSATVLAEKLRAVEAAAQQLPQGGPRAPESEAMLSAVVDVHKRLAELESGQRLSGQIISRFADIDNHLNYVESIHQGARLLDVEMKAAVERLSRLEDDLRFAREGQVALSGKIAETADLVNALQRDNQVVLRQASSRWTGMDLLVQDLRGSLTDLQAFKAEMLNERTHTETAVHRLHGATDTLAKHGNDVQLLIERCNAMVDEMQRQASAAQDGQQLAQELAAENSRLRTQVAQLAPLQRRLDEALESAAAGQRSLEAARARLLDAEAARETAREALALEHGAAQKRSAALEEANAALEGANAALGEANAALEIELSGCYQEIFESSRYVGILTKDRSELASKVNELTGHLAYKVEQLQAATDRASGSETFATEAQQLREQLRQEQQKAAWRRDAEEAAVRAAREEAARSDRLAAEAENLRRAHDLDVATIGDLKRRLAALVHQKAPNASRGPHKQQ
jgi:FkbM family methyltransferase